MYKWEAALANIVHLFETEVNLSPASTKKHVVEAVNKFAELLRRELAFDLRETRVPETIAFLKKSIVIINSLVPESEPDRLAVKIPLDPPRIEIHLIKKTYTLPGRLAFITDHCPTEEAGECLAIVYLAVPPKTTVH